MTAAHVDRLQLIARDFGALCEVWKKENGVSDVEIHLFLTLACPLHSIDSHDAIKKAEGTA